MRRGTTITLIAAAVSVLISCERETAADEAKEVATIVQAVVDSARPSIDAVTASWKEALQKGDVAAMLATYAPDAISFQAGAEPASTAAGLTEVTTAFSSAGTFSDVTAKTDELYPVGTDMVLEFASFSATLTPKDGKPVPQKGRYMNLWKKQPDGSWKVFRDMMVSSLPQ